MSALSENHAHDVKRLGILSQTLAPSPHVRWILPARIRSRQYHDVVFVGESCIQLREFLPNGQLADATAKLNIGAQIMAAKVISAKIRKVPRLDTVLDQEWDEEEFLIKGEPCNDEQPPQLVVLCTAAGELVYVYAKSAIGTGVRFVLAKRTILHGISILSKYGKHMAVDQESRLLAVASADACAVFSLRHIDDLKESIDHWQPRHPASFQPNKEQRFLPIDGTIVRMEFLHSPSDEPARVYLLLIVAKAGETRLLLYRWDCRESLVTMEPMKCSGYTLPEYDSFPLLLVTAARPLSFWIVTETELVIYENLRSPHVKRTGTRLPANTTSNQRELWVQWAKPSRHEQFLSEKEDILLMREDGATRVFSRTHSPPSNSIQSVSPGTLEMRIDTAVCMLPGPRYMGGDILIVGGVGSDGGVFHLPPRKLPILLQTISNVSPIFDMGVLDSTADSALRHGSSARTFVLSDGTNGEKLHELRLGLEGQVGWTMPLEQCATIDRLWALESHETGKLYFLASHPDRTVAVEFNIHNHDELEALEPESSRGFNLSAQTLAAATLPSGNIVQITSDGINVITTLRLSEPSVTLPLHYCVCADLEPTSGIFVTATNVSGGYELRVGVIGSSKKCPEIILAPILHNVSGRPQVLRILQHKKFHVLVVGYFDGSVQLFTIHPEHGLQEQQSILGSGTKGAGISGISLLSRNASSHALVLVGSIDGVLQIYGIQLNANGVDSGKHVSSFSPLASYRLGTTAVSLAPGDRDTFEPASTLITCGRRTCHLRCLSSGPFPDFVLDDVWITSRADISFEQPRINAIHRIPFLTTNAGAEPSGIVMCATDNEILFTSLLDQEQMVPRCLAECKGARHLVYSRYLKKFIIGADGQREPPRKAVLHLVDPETATVHDRSTISVVCGEENERIKALIGWNPSDGKRHYELFLVALSNGQNSRIGHVTAKKLAFEENSEGSFKTVLRFVGKETHALCAFGMSSAIISVGNQLTLLHLDMNTKKFSQLAVYDLPSSALSVSSRGSHIYAATTKHSMLVLQVEANTFKRVFADRAAKNARSVVPFGQDAKHVMLSTVSDAGTYISGYIEGGSSGDYPTPSFEAQVALPIDHLVPVSTAWTHDQQYGLQGTTLDGTVYLFKTLTYEEWRLLRFLEKLAQPDISKPGKRMSLLTKKMARTWVSSMEQDDVTTFDPRSMHVRGDVLQRLIEEGPYDLRRLLGVEVKTEDEMVVDSEHHRYTKFESVAVPVVGQTEHLVLAVVTWIRKLLRSSVF